MHKQHFNYVVGHGRAISTYVIYCLVVKSMAMCHVKQVQKF